VRDCLPLSIELQVFIYLLSINELLEKAYLYFAFTMSKEALENIWQNIKY
jgi:hypothetical protein